MDLIYLAHPVRPPPGSTETVDSNLDDAEWWFTALQRANPDVAFTMDWALELRLRVGRDEIPEDRAVGIARACGRAARCTGIALCGPRISSGKLDELAAVASQGRRVVAHRFADRRQSLALPPARDWAAPSLFVDRPAELTPSWLRNLWIGASPLGGAVAFDEIQRAAAREAGR